MKFQLTIFTFALFYALNGQTPYQSQISSGAFINVNLYIWKSGDVLVGNGGFQCAGTTQMDINASDYVTAQPGFEATGLNSGGYVRLAIDPSKIGVSCVTNPQFQVPTYERLELGVSLPDAIQDQIDNFLLNKAGPKINPYDKDQIRVECEFSQSNLLNVQYRRSGFYYRDYEVVPGSNLWTEIPTLWPFRVRFAPPKAGLYIADIKVYLNNASFPAHTSTEFYVSATASAKPGHLNLSSNPDIQKLEYDDGTPFFAVGRNIPGAEFDGFPANQNIPQQKNWNEQMASPNTHNQHRALLSDLFNNQGNFARVRLDNWSVPIEARDKTLPSQPLTSALLSSFLNNYHHNQPYMWEMDQTVAVCESYNAHMMLNILNDQDIIIDGDTTGQSSAGNNAYSWLGCPYAGLLGSTAQDQLKFFTDPTAIEYFKKRLFYIEARWGYSTAIGLWELINETENAANSFQNGQWFRAHDQNTTAGANLRAAIGSWVCQMRNYLRQTSVYPQHPVTNGTTNSPGTNTNFEANQYSQCLDVYSSNAYTWDYNPGSSGPPPPIIPPRAETNTWAVLDFTYPYSGYWNSPPTNKKFIWGEVGHFSGVIDNYDEFTFHNTTWMSIFANNLGTAMYWNSWNEYACCPHRVHYNAIRAFTNKIDWSQVMWPLRNNWSIYPPWNTFSQNLKEPGEAPIHTYWLTTTDSKKVFGWSRNTSANWTTYGYSNATAIVTQTTQPFVQNVQNSTNFSGVPAINIILNTQNATVVQGLLKSQLYQVKIYDTWDPSGAQLDVFNITSDAQGIIKFGRTMRPLVIKTTDPDYPDYPDFAFIATYCEGSCPEAKSISNNSNETSLTKTTIVDDISAYPTPAQDKLFIKTGSDIRNISNLKLVDALGREFFVVFDNNAINVGSFAPGTYFIEFDIQNTHRVFKVVLVD
jgi:hypothetical protein